VSGTFGLVRPFASSHWLARRVMRVKETPTLATTWKTIAVRIERPSEVALADFLAAIRSWLDHHCIMLANFRGKTDVFDAVFDNPRDARLFERRFAIQPTISVPERVASRRPARTTISPAPTVGGLAPMGDAA